MTPRARRAIVRGMLPRPFVLRAPGLALRALPAVVVVLAARAVLQEAGVTPLELNALLTGIVGAEVFLLGFLLAGTLGDYKESERLPAEIASAVEAIADEALALHAEKGEPAARAALVHLHGIARDVHAWLCGRGPADGVIDDVRALNQHTAAFTPLVPPGFVSRMRNEQAALRRAVLRIETVRETSFVAAGYAAAELTGAALIAGLLVADIGPLGQAMFLIGALTFLLAYLLVLIRDLDDPFGATRGARGAADVSLAPLEDLERRLAQAVAGTAPSLREPVSV